MYFSPDNKKGEIKMERMNLFGNNDKSSEALSNRKEESSKALLNKSNQNLSTINVDNYSYQVDFRSDESCKSCVQQINKDTGKSFKVFREKTGKENYVLYDSKMYEICEFNYRYLHYIESCSKPPVMPFNASSCYNMFAELDGQNDIDFNHFDTSEIVEMTSMFMESNFKTLDLSHFSTDNLKDTSFMFMGCVALEQVDLSSFSNCKVIHADYMFAWCSSLTKVDLSNFNLQNTLYMESMFQECKSLKEVIFSKPYPIDIKNLFSECKSLTTVDLSDFDFSRLLSARQAFYNCENLKTIYSVGWFLAPPKDADEFLRNFSIKERKEDKLFCGCKSLVGFNPEKVNSDMAKSIEEGGYFITPNGKEKSKWKE